MERVHWAYVTVHSPCQLANPVLVHEKSYIDGKWVNALNGQTQPVYNKATNEVLAEVVDQGRQDTEMAVKAAEEAFQTWSKTTPHERHNYLLALFAKIQENAEDFARLIVAENGKAISDARGEVNYANSYVQWFAEEALRIQ